MTPPSASRAPAAYPGRMVFPPWRRTRCGATGPGEIAGPVTPHRSRQPHGRLCESLLWEPAKFEGAGQIRRQAQFPRIPIVIARR